MKVMRLWEVLLSYGLIITFAVLLVFGVFSPLLLIPAALALGGYFVWGWLKLRCPGCGAFINLDRLIYARHHDFHCPSCGQEIHVK